MNYSSTDYMWRPLAEVQSIRNYSAVVFRCVVTLIRMNVAGIMPASTAVQASVEQLMRVLDEYDAEQNDAENDEVICQTLEYHAACFVCRFASFRSP